MKSTDRALRDAVMAVLDWDDHVETTNIGVIANNGAVTLTGFVHSPIQQRAAVSAAKHVPGVAVVADELEVRLPGSPMRTDAEIAVDIARERQWSPVIPASVLVTVKDGRVILEGEADAHIQCREAEWLFGGIRGVREVQSRIAVRQQRPPDAREVESRVDDAIRAMADTDARSIHAAVDGETVRLQGTVRTVVERRVAESAAAAAPGVAGVVNEIVIAS